MPRRSQRSAATPNRPAGLQHCCGRWPFIPSHPKPPGTQMNKRTGEQFDLNSRHHHATMALFSDRHIHRQQKPPHNIFITVTITTITLSAYRRFIMACRKLWSAGHSVIDAFADPAAGSSLSDITNHMDRHDPRTGRGCSITRKIQTSVGAVPFGQLSRTADQPAL